MLWQSVRRRAIYIIQPFFLLLVMLPVIAVCVLHYRQVVSERRGKERLEREHLQTVSVPQESLRWAKAGKEIWVNNHLFDVKSYRLENGIYTFRGLFDEDETLIVKQVRKQDQQQNTNNTRLLGQLFKLLNTVYYEQGDNLSPAEDIHSPYFGDKDSPLASLFRIVNVPPPKA